MRELIDGTAGMTTGDDVLAKEASAWWERRRDRLEQVAREAGDR